MLEKIEEIKRDLKRAKARKETCIGHTDFYGMTMADIRIDRLNKMLRRAASRKDGGNEP